MLLRLSVSNYLSIAAQQEFSLVASKLKGPKEGLLTIPNSDLSALPSAVVYGPNASGKTNFIKAFNFFRGAILESHTRGDPEGGVPRIPFALDPDSLEKPTELEADFLVEGIRFQYGFQCNNDKFIAEWLYSYPEGKRRKVFVRSGSNVSFGQTFKGPKKILVELMRANSLFISTATQNDHEELTRVVNFFRKSKYSGTVSVAAGMINNTFKKDQLDSRTVSFLRMIGTGIIGYRETDVNVPDMVRELEKEFSNLIRKHVGEHSVVNEFPSNRDNSVAIEFAHRGLTGENHYFGLERESSGTRRLILVMNMIFKAIDEGSLVFIDELDASLHTHAAEQILKLFSDPMINKRGAQLIATTHDTNLLNSTCLRRDQIWFFEKDDTGASHLFPLSEIKSRQSDNFEQGYLEGRYGAIPFAGDFTSLFKA